MKRKLKRIVAEILSVMMLLTGMDVNSYVALANDNISKEETVVVDEGSTEVSQNITNGETEGTIPQDTSEVLVDDVGKEPTIPDSKDTKEIIPTESVFEGKDFTVTFKVVDSWEGGYNAKVLIENTGETTIENWMLSFDYLGTFNSLWGAMVIKNEDNHYIVKNAGYNQDIQAKQSIEFGMNGNGNFVGFPEKYNLVSELVDAKESTYSVEYTLYSDWGSGFNSCILLTNNSGETIEDWILEFDYDREITEISNGVVKEHKGNHYVVKNCGYNANITSGNSITCTINGHGGSAECEPYNCKLISSQLVEHKVDIDLARVEKAYSLLDIGFSGDDTYDSVKENLQLPTSVNDCVVSWTSDKPDVVTVDGTVNRQEETSEVVHLVATISLNESSLEKEFEVRVVKSMYADYSLDDIIVMEDMMELYYYNDIIEDLQVYTNDLGYLDFVVGSITDIKVDSYDEAILALQGVKNLIGMADVEKELRPESVFRDESGYVYTFRQMYNEIPVFGSSISVSTDLDGNTIGLNSYYVPFELDITPSLTSEAAMNATTIDCLSVIRSELNVFIDDGNARLAWNVEFKDSHEKVCTALVDANDAEVLYQTKGYIQISATGYGKDEFNTDQKFNTTYDYNVPTYYMTDYQRNISTYNLNKDFLIDPTTVSVYTSDKCDWNRTDDPVAISVYTNMAKVYDYYNTELGRKGFSGSGEHIKVYFNWYDSNACYDYGTKYCVYFGGPTKKERSFGASLATVAHEYTHGVNRSITSFGDYSMESSAIDEAYADTMGMLISRSSTWQVCLPDGTIDRDIINPHNSNASNQCPDVYNGMDWSDDWGLYGKAGHNDSTVISHAFYYMSQNGISRDRLVKLVYRSLGENFSESSTFVQVRKNCTLAAGALNFSDYEKKAMNDAFDLAGITLDSQTNEALKKQGVTISGKVVKADHYNNPANFTKLSDVKVKIVRRGYSGEYCAPIYTEDGLYSVSKLIPGVYYFTFSKEGYKDTTMQVTVQLYQNTYLDTVEMIPNEYTGKGHATGKVVDAVNGQGVSEMTLTVRSGLGTLSGTAVATVTTDENGNFTLKDLSTGHYTVEVSDQRSGIEKANKYFKVYKNITILGPHTVTIPNIAVSTKLDSGKMRIVLEWGYSPRDLDSHMVGFDALGRQTFHTYYVDKTYTKDGILVVDLDLDDTSSYGPETTTIHKKTEDRYVFYVHQYSSDGSLITSNAIIKVYMGTGSVAKYIFNVPMNGYGRYWTAFEYDVNKGQLKTINIISSSPILN